MKVKGIKVQMPKYVPRDGNSKSADGFPCFKCHMEIPIIYLHFKNNLVVDRRIRIDVDGKRETIRSYHLPCYDLEVFGYIRHETLRKMRNIPYYFNLVMDGGRALHVG